MDTHIERQSHHDRETAHTETETQNHTETGRSRHRETYTNTHRIRNTQTQIYTNVNTPKHSDTLLGKHRHTGADIHSQWAQTHLWTHVASEVNMHLY